MLNQVMQLSFKLYDLQLYLDTHPTENSALQEYNNTLNKYKASVEHYEKLYGPLNVININESQKEWMWTKGPWPWEKQNEKDGDK